MIAKTFVPVCDSPPETNTTGMGRVEKRIVRYLSTAPAGFAGAVGSSEGETLEHGEPCGVTLDAVARVVYETEAPTAAQTRAVQRATRRLADVGVVARWHGATRFRDETRVTSLGFLAAMPVPVVFVALATWGCGHRRDA